MKNFNNINKNNNIEYSYIKALNMEKYNVALEYSKNTPELAEKYHLGLITFIIILLVPISFIFKIIFFLMY